MRRGVALAGRLLLLSATLAVSLLLLELGLRAAGVAEPEQATPITLPGLPASTDPFSRPDKLLIYSLTPHAKTFDWFEIDRHGFRTPEFPEQKAPGTLRVVVTGDSTTFGLGMLEEQRWSSVLRRALTGLIGDLRPVEVINAGVLGYSTLQNRLQIQQRLLPLDPDLIVFLVTAGNDATRVEGPTDAEIVGARHTLAGRLANFRIARLLGSRPPQYGSPPGPAAPGSTTARPRVSAPEVRENLLAIADMLPGRVVFGIFQSQDQRARSADVDAVAEAVADVARERRMPLADCRADIEALLPYPLYLDAVHPTAVGHEIIARQMLVAILPVLGLPAERQAWLTDFAHATAGPLPAPDNVLRGPGAPPRCARILALYDRGDIDAQLRDGAAELLPCVRDWDPLLGRNSGSRSILVARDEAQRVEIASFVRPTHPLLRAFPDVAPEGLVGLVPAERLNLARALVAWSAELGLPPRRLDLRRGLAAKAADSAEAVTLLDAALALDPHDDEVRFDRSWQLRRAGRRPEARADLVLLAAGTGPLADFSRGFLAREANDAPAAEAALRAAIAAAPALGYAHDLLGRLYLDQGRYEEATRELILAAVQLGSVESLPALLAQVEAKRTAAAAGP